MRAGRTRSGDARLTLIERLRARHDEIEQTVLARLHAIAPVDGEMGSQRYPEGLRIAVSAAIDYGLELIGYRQGETSAPPVPQNLLEQVRIAARAGVSLDTILRRYLAGYTLLGDFLIEEAQSGTSLPQPELRQILRTQAMLFDRLVATVTQQHASEWSGPQPTGETRRLTLVTSLLRGELIAGSELGYPLEGHHLGAVLAGRDALAAVCALGDALDRRRLAVQSLDGCVWLWLGGREEFTEDELEVLARHRLPAGLSCAIGEPGQDRWGWRLTHRQALAAQTVAGQSGDTFVRYADVALLASMLKDDVLRASLQDLFLSPLRKQNYGVLLQTLRAYFAADRNTSSAAAALGVSRQTVAKRLRLVEERLGRPISDRGLELEAVLRLEALRS